MSESTIVIDNNVPPSPRPITPPHSAHQRARKSTSKGVAIPASVNRITTTTVPTTPSNDSTNSNTCVVTTNNIDNNDSTHGAMTSKTVTSGNEDATRSVSDSTNTTTDMLSPVRHKDNSQGVVVAKVITGGGSLNSTSSVVKHVVQSSTSGSLSIASSTSTTTSASTTTNTKTSPSGSGGFKEVDRLKFSNPGRHFEEQPLLPLPSSPTNVSCCVVTSNSSSSNGDIGSVMDEPKLTRALRRQLLDCSKRKNKYRGGGNYSQYQQYGNCGSFNSPYQSLYDSRGRSLNPRANHCDCLRKNCPGCHFPCRKCHSPLCGPSCRIYRTYRIARVSEEEGCKTLSVFDKK